MKSAFIILMVIVQWSNGVKEERVTDIKPFSVEEFLICQQIAKELNKIATTPGPLKSEGKTLKNVEGLTVEIKSAKCEVIRK